MLLDLFILRADVVTYDGSCTTGWLVQTRQHVHRRCLACTVSTEETEYLASLHREADVVNGMERSEGLDQVRDLNHILVFCLRGFLVLDARRIEDVLKTVEDNIRRIDVSYLPVVKECHTFAAAHLVKIGRRGHDGDAALLQHQEHLPEFFSAHWVNTRGRLIKEQYARAMYQRTRQG